MLHGAYQFDNSDERSIKETQLLFDITMKLYEFFHEEIKAAKHRSAITKKPVLVLSGEHHESFFSSLMEMAAMTAAIEQGFRRFCVELDDDRLKDGFKDEMLQYLSKKPEFLRDKPTFHSIYFLSKMLLKVEPIDQGCDGEKLKDYQNRTKPDVSSFVYQIGIIKNELKYRNEIMAENLRSKNQDTVAFVGTDHLYGLMEQEKLSDYFEVVLCHAAPKCGVEYRLSTMGLIDWLKGNEKPLRYLLEVKNKLHFHLINNHIESEYIEYGSLKDYRCIVNKFATQCRKALNHSNESMDTAHAATSSRREPIIHAAPRTQRHRRAGATAHEVNVRTNNTASEVVKKAVTLRQGYKKK